VTDQNAFTADEWTLLRVTPSFVAVGVVAADASGLFASLKETLAGVKEVNDALGSSSDLELFRALAEDRSPPAVPDVEPLLGAGPKDVQLENFKAAVLERVSAAVALLNEKASSRETDAYRRLLVRVAQRAADAAKEGGFFGFGGVRVSEKERAFIEAVTKAAGGTGAANSI
jgi:hypothetical protein